MDQHIYVVEDDENIREIIYIALTNNGYRVSLFDNAVSALDQLSKEHVDMMIFDLMLPNMSGIDAIKKVRESGYDLPILILSAKDREIDIVNGLYSGSDDYMTKPFGVLELQARVATLLRRRQTKIQMLHTPTLEINKNTRTIKQNKKNIVFTNKEYKLLLYLIENKDRIINRDELLNNIWGYGFVGESRVLDVHIRALRAKLNDDGNHYIKTIRGVGYRFIEEVMEDAKSNI